MADDATTASNGSDGSGDLGPRLRVEALGRQGDGIARDAAGSAVFVAMALPGDEVARREDGTYKIVATTSPDRAVPPCPHFSSCGGCLAQHMSAKLYTSWKRDIVTEAFRQQGFADAPIAGLVSVGHGSRRRVVLTAQAKAGAVRLGYHARGSHDLVDITTCVVAVPAVTAALPGLRKAVSVLGVAEARLSVLATSTGLDVAITAEVKRITPPVANALALVAGEHRFARVSLNGEPIVTRAVPGLDIAGVSVAPPPGGFVQAVAEAEEMLRTLMLDAIGNAKRVADLFCGLGAFSFALARKARVLAADNDKPAMASLTQAMRHAQGLKPVTPLLRDLFRDPLGPKELEEFDAVVLDPPRAGADAQARALARSDVPTVVYVSCNPQTLARDVRSLVDGGFALEAVTPVDQFLYSEHVEAVAVLRKPRRPKRR